MPRAAPLAFAPCLAVPAPQAGADLLLGVHPQIAVGVFHQPDIRRFVHEDAVIERLHGTRLHESIREDGALVHPAVVVGILEHGDPADRIQIRFRVREIAHVFRILDHPESAVRIPIDRNRILDERFGVTRLLGAAVILAGVHLARRGEEP